MGIVKKFTWPALRRNQPVDGEFPDSMLIKFDNESIESPFKDIADYVPISPAVATLQMIKDSGDVERRMSAPIRRFDSNCM